MNDLRFACRQLLKHPGFTTVAVLTMALGIGATTAVFSLVHGLIFRPLPFPDPGRLVWIANIAPDGTSRRTTLRDWRERSQSFAGLAGYHAFSDRIDSIFTGSGEPSPLRCLVVTENFLEVLGVQPRLGRSFVDREYQGDGLRTVILTDRFWRRQFQADAGIVGRSISINNLSWTVVGVLPDSFNFSSLFSPGSKEVDFLRPAPKITEPKDTAGNIMAVVGRLKPGVTVSRAQAEFEVLNRQLKSAHPESKAGYEARLTSLPEHISGRFRRPFLVLACAVGGVLLIGCINLSNLLLARATARQREFAVRLALGASRARLIRQMLTECLLLSTCGAALGLGLAFVATHAVAHSRGFMIPRLRSVGVDREALGFSLLVSVGAGLLFGIVPALRLSNRDVQAELSESNRGSSQGRRGARLRGVLVVSEVALTCVLLVGAGLLTRSFLRLVQVDPGFQPEHVMAWRVVASGGVATSGQASGFYQELIRRIEAIPGVESAGLTGNLPLRATENLKVRAKGGIYRQDEIPPVFVRQVNEGYFKTMRIPLRKGRDFDPHDSGETRENRVVVVNEKLAGSLWPGKDPIGRILLVDDDPGAEWEVVGVVGNVRQRALEFEAGPEMYMTGRRWDQQLLVRARGNAASIVPAVRGVLCEINPGIASDEFESLSQVIDQAVSPRRLVAILLTLFSLLALLLASIGIYGVIAYSAAQRTQEIGIRLALGSPRAAVLALIIGQGMKPALAGCLIGLPASLAATRIMQSMLFEVDPADPLTLALSGLVLTAVALLACWLPARRAARVDPIQALRTE